MIHNFNVAAAQNLWESSIQDVIHIWYSYDVQGNEICLESWCQKINCLNISYRYFHAVVNRMLLYLSDLMSDF